MNIAYFYLVPAYGHKKGLFDKMLIFPRYELAKAEVMKQIYAHFIDHDHFGYANEIRRRAVNHNDTEQRMCTMKAKVVQPIEKRGTLVVEVNTYWEDLGKASGIRITIVTDYDKEANYKKHNLSVYPN
jgi:hypothetical protein